jgi:ferric-dicitrate binding protein FerR (iron transport regulator)
MCERFAEDVILDFRQGRLPPEEAAALAAHLAGCPSCRDADRALAPLLAPAGPAPEPGPAADREVRRLVARAAAAGRAARRRRQAAALAAVALLAAGGWFAWSALRPAAAAPGPVVARLEAAPAGVVVRRDGVEVAARPGMELHARDTVAVSSDGSALIEFADDSRAELGPETTLALNDPGGGGFYLAEGFLAVEAAPHPAKRPLQIWTPEARADVLGTKFTLAAVGRQTNLRVAEGSVRLVRSRDGTSVDVRGGFHAKVNGAGGLAPAPGLSGTVLLVVAPQRAWPEWKRFNELLRERLVGSRLRRLGFRVEVRDHQDLRREDLAGRPLVILSVAEFNVGLEESLRRAGLRDAAVPVMCLEPLAFPCLGMTGPRQGRDFEWEKGPARVTFPNPGHPLSGGLAGERGDLFGRVGCLGWARPAGDAAVIAAVAADPSRVTAFGYEAGARMASGKAPARRVGLFLDPAQVDEGADAAWALFEAAVDWCAEPPAGR